MKHVIIGASAAGLSAAHKLRTLCPTDDITVISSDTMVYSRCMLHHVISGRRSIESLRFVPSRFFADNRIDWQQGKIVNALDTDGKQIYMTNSGSITYDTLLIATGAQSVIPPIPNLTKADRVFTLHELADAVDIAAQIAKGDSAVVIGGGLIGLDAALGMAEKGIQVTIIEMSSHILPLQLDQKSADRYERRLRQQGIRLVTGKSVQEVLLDNNNRITALSLSDGTKVNASAIVVAAGVRPNTGWIQDPTIRLERGIVIDDYCRTTATSVFAAGDVTGKSGIWPLAVKQGVTAACNMAGHSVVLHDQFNLKNSMNFCGLQTVSLGLAEAPDDTYDVDIYETADTYKKIIHRDGIVVGAIIQGDIAHSGFWAKAISSQLNIQKITGKNIFDVDYSDFFHIRLDGQFEYAATNECC